jgi:hypothetical protein
MRFRSDNRRARRLPNRAWAPTSSRQECSRVRRGGPRSRLVEQDRCGYCGQKNSGPGRRQRRLGSNHFSLVPPLAKCGGGCRRDANEGREVTPGLIRNHYDMVACTTLRERSHPNFSGSRRFTGREYLRPRPRVVEWQRGFRRPRRDVFSSASNSSTYQRPRMVGWCNTPP